MLTLRKSNIAPNLSYKINSRRIIRLISYVLIYLNCWCLGTPQTVPLLTIKFKESFLTECAFSKCFRDVPVSLACSIVTNPYLRLCVVGRHKPCVVDLGLSHLLSQYTSNFRLLMNTLLNKPRRDIDLLCDNNCLQIYCVGAFKGFQVTSRKLVLNTSAFCEGISVRLFMHLWLWCSLIRQYVVNLSPRTYNSKS